MRSTRLNQYHSSTSGEMLLRTLEMLPDALFLLDDTGQILYANEQAQALGGIRLADGARMTFWRGAIPLVSTALYRAVVKTSRTGELTNVDYLSPFSHLHLRGHVFPTDTGILLHIRSLPEQVTLPEESLQHASLSPDMLDGLQAAVAIVTPEGMVLEVNQSLLDESGIRREDIIGRLLIETPWWNHSPELQEHTRAAICQACEQGKVLRFDMPFLLGNEPHREIEATLLPHKHEGEVEYLLFIGIDVTNHKQADQEIRTLLDSLPQFVWVGAATGDVTYYNRRWQEYTGLSVEQARGEGWMMAVHPDDRASVLESWHYAAQNGQVHEIILRLRCQSTDEYRWFLARGEPVRDASDGTLKFLGTCTDINDWMQAEQHLKASEEQWRILAETMPQLVWTTAAQGGVDYFNQRWYTFTGSTPEQCLGYSWSQFLHPDDYERTLRAWNHALETRQPYEIEYRFRHAQTGEYRWFLARAMPVLDREGRAGKWIGTCTDIESAKQVEQRLKASEESWHLLAELVPHFVWIAQPEGDIVYFNQRYYDFTGSFPEESLGFGWASFIHPEDRERILKLRREYFAAGQPYQLEYRMKEVQSQKYRWFLIRAMPVHDEHGRIIKWFGTSTDIDEQKRIEATLRQSQQRMLALRDANIIGIIFSTHEQLIVDANNAFLRMTGYSHEDVERGLLEQQRLIPPEYNERIQHVIEETRIVGQHSSVELELVCKDHSRLPILFGGVTFQEDPWQMIGFILDNSASKALEQRKNDFISMASHELRNPLATLTLQTDLLGKQLSRLDLLKNVPALERMKLQLNKLNRLVGELLDVSKIQAGRIEYQQEPVDLAELVREIVDTIQQTTTHTIQIEHISDICINADRDRLGQVLINLLGNAIKYSPDAREIEVNLDISEEEIILSVRDHGLGIPHEQRDKIFERFYRISPSQRKNISGLGMGLYIVEDIVKHYSGTISIESEVGQGSTFSVHIPLQSNSLLPISQTYEDS